MASFKTKGNTRAASGGTKPKKREPEKVGPVQNVYVQIGDKNIMKIEEVKREILDHKDNSGISKQEVVIRVLQHLIVTNEKKILGGVELSQLRVKFEEMFKADKNKKHFKDIVGLPIDLFIDKNIDNFKKCQKRGKINVTLKRKKHSTKFSHQYESQLSSTNEEQSDTLSETETERDYFTAVGSQMSESSSDDSTYTGFTLTKSNRFSNSGSENELRNNERETKMRKRTRGKHNGSKEKLAQSKHIAKDFVETRKNIDFQKLSLLESLIKKPEDRDVLFCHPEDIYFQEPNEFMLDLTSMWNTPARSKSYIVLGVRACLNLPHELIGLRKSYQKSDFESIARKVMYTGCPLYQYFEVTLNTKLYGIIEIESSHGCGQPCVLKFPTNSPNQKYEEEIWIRSGTNRKLCQFSDPETTMMFQWFAKLHSPSRRPNGRTKKTDETNEEIHLHGVNNYTRKEDLSMVFKDFDRGHYILMAGDIPKGMSHAETISLVPWIVVYDFDIYSRDNGLLSSNEDFLAKRRSLHISTWNSKEHPHNISENSTIWFFPKGYRERPESRVKEKNVRLWFQKVKQGIDNNIDQLQKFVSDYTVLTIVIFCPQDKQLIPFILKLLERIDDRVDPAPKLILCIPDRPSGNYRELESLCDYHKDNISVVKMNLSEVCEEIGNIRKDANRKKDIRYELPFSNGDQVCQIDEKGAAWLKEHLEVLYKVNPYNKAKLEDLQNEMDDFFKGGSLHWYAWYECGAGHIDVERDVLKDILLQIQVVVDENRPGFFTLYHAPGSGGSTLAQRILWDLHFKLPCVHVKIKTSCSVQEIIEKVEFIYEKSRCAVILLIDGEDETKVKNIFRTMKTRSTMAIIIYVKRHVIKITANSTSLKQAWLKGYVSIDEAKKFALKFGDRCKDDHSKKAKLNSLCADVANNRQHYLYEFGLTTYLHEFKGIESYVGGYLNLQGNERDELHPVHKMLGFLSLVYYYGQTSLSCQFFSSLLNLPSNSDMSLSDLPDPIEYFVVPDDHDGRRKNIRICHFLIAKEILEQILSRHTLTQRERSADLSHAARHNLANFCLEFIDYANRKKVKSYVKPHGIIHVLTRTFIFRDNRDMGQNAEQIRKKPVLSKVMVDIASSPPYFSERLKVLQKLTLAFPDDPNFHAHLGRFYAYCRPDEETEVENCFQKAIKLCEERTKNKTTSDIEDRWKMSIMHIYHMYGTVLLKRIARFTGQSPDDKPEKETKDEEFSEVMEQIVSMAKTACSYFLQCREYTPSGQDNCFGYVGEITVRLQVCDFVQKYFSESGQKGIYGFLSPTITKSIAGRKFVKNSISIIDSLFMECYRFLEHDDIDNSIQRAQLWYNFLFRGKSDDFESLAVGDDVFAHRLRITAKKLKYGARTQDISLLEDVSSQDDIQDIVQTYEKIFQGILRTGIQGSKRALEIDYIEWMYAIRHGAFKDDYKFEAVHQIVRQWNEQLRSPMSKFYLFIISSLLGFNGKSESLVEAQILNDELKQMVKYVLKPKYPREWLGKNNKGIRRLVPGTRFLGLNIEDREMKTVHHNLELCKGTVCAPNNKKLSGFISLDLGGDNTVPVSVFYIPNAVNMATTQYSGKRVEFYLAFSLGHGYEAFNVKPIQKYGCSTQSCSSRVEITTQEDFAMCSGCYRKVYKDPMNTVDD